MCARYVRRVLALEARRGADLRLPFIVLLAPRLAAAELLSEMGTRLIGRLQAGVLAKVHRRRPTPRIQRVPAPHSADAAGGPVWGFTRVPPTAAHPFLHSRNSSSCRYVYHPAHVRIQHWPACARGCCSA